MIQVSPHTEPQTAVHETGVSQKPKPEKSTLGVFAKILAGLSGRALPAKELTEQNPAINGMADKGAKTGKKSAGTQASAEIALQEAALQEAALHEAALDEAAGNAGKKVRTGKTAALAGLTGETEAGVRKTRKTGETEPEPALIELSAQEKNVLFTVERLTGKTGEQSREEVVSKTTAVDAARLNRETAKTGAAMATSAETAAEQGKQPLPAHVLAASEAADNQKDNGKRIKGRVNPVETSAHSDFSGGKVTGQEFTQRSETKKTVSSEKEAPTRLEESRNRRRAVTLDVRDFRTTTEGASRDGNVQMRVGAETRLPGEGTAREITLELRLPNQGQDVSSATTAWETKASQSLENMLARELHQNFNNDIVRHASVALRDGNEGTIRLALKPESLGNVKIHLEMAENKIVGHIVVESEEALRAFEREISSLEKAFRDSGFEAADLEMSLASDGRGAQQQWQEMEASHFLAEQFAASRYDAAVEQMELPLTLDVYQQGTRAVNVLA